jgi:5-methylcytosine-specific restriction endonuclease McrA
MTDETSCPTCGRDDFKTAGGMKNHHAAAHDERLGVTLVECDACGSEFEERQDHAKKFDHHFCDEDCEGEWRSGYLEGDNSPVWSRVETSCSQCGAEMYIEQSDSRYYDRHFCDRECQGEWLSEFQSGETNTVTKDCTSCGQSITRPPSHFPDSGRQFCNRECQGEWVSETNTGESNPSWKGGPVQVSCAVCGEQKMIGRSYSKQRKRHFCSPEHQGEWLAENRTREDAYGWKGGYEGYYGQSWQQKRRERLEYDGHKCAVCGTSAEVHREKHGRGLHVHHITPFRKFGLEEHQAANHLDNLLTVCATCHHKIEGWGIAPPSGGDSE